MGAGASDASAKNAQESQERTVSAGSLVDAVASTSQPSTGKVPEPGVAYLSASSDCKLQEPMVAADNLQESGLAQDTGELTQYFFGPCLQGKLYEGLQYSLDSIGELLTFRYDAPDGAVHVWRHAFDLRDLQSPDSNLQSSDSKEGVRILHHNTNELAFLNIGDLEQSSTELFASLVDIRAHFGKGVYASQHEPSAFKLRVRILLNNYSNGSPDCRADDPEHARVLSEWADSNPSGHRAGFCIPIIAPEQLAYSIFQKQTPDLAEKQTQDPTTGKLRPVHLGEDYEGRTIHRARDAWVLRSLDTSGKVVNASVEADSVLELLKLRLRKLRDTDGDAGPATLDCMSELTGRLAGRAQHAEAEKLQKECLECLREKLGNDAHRLLTMSNLATLLKDQGQPQEAELLYREALKTSRAKLGNDHEHTLLFAGNLAILLQDCGQLQESEPLYREVLEGRRRRFGKNHPETLGALNDLAYLLKVRNELDEAELLYRETLDGRRTKLGNNHPETLNSMHNLAAYCYFKDD